MECSYCCQPLPEDDESVPNVRLENKPRTGVFLALHAECIKEVQDGLELCRKLVTN